MNGIESWWQRIQSRYTYRVPMAILCTAGLIAITGLWAIADRTGPEPGDVATGPSTTVPNGGGGQGSKAGSSRQTASTQPQAGKSGGKTAAQGSGGASSPSGDASGGTQAAGTPQGGPAPAAQPGAGAPPGQSAACPEGLDKGACTGITASTIRIGTHAADTECGAPIPDTTDENEAEADDWVEYINKVQGGVNGKKLELHEADDGYCPEMAGQAARELIDEKRVFAVEGFLGVDQNRTVAEYAQGRQVPYLAGGGPKEWAARWSVFHQNQSSYDVMYPALLKYIIGSQGLDKPDAKIGVMYVDTPEVKEPTLRSFDTVPDANVVKSIPLQSGIKQNFLEEIRQLREAGADVVYCNCHPLNMVAFVQQADTQQYKPQYTFVSQGADLDVVLRLFPGDSTWAKNAKGLSNFCHPSHPCSARYDRELKKIKPNVEMSQLGLIGIHAIEMFAEPMRRAGANLSRPSYMQQLASLEGWTTGTTAPVDLAPDRSVGLTGFTVYESPGTGSRNYKMVDKGGKPFRSDW